MSGHNIEQRVATSLAIGRYLRTRDRFENASREFTEACQTLREQLGPNCRFIVEANYRHYLVTSDNDGNFDVEHIESL